MNKLLSCRFNMDTNRVEAQFADSTTLAIDCTVIEDEYGNTPAQRAEPGLAALQQALGIRPTCAGWRDRTLPVVRMRPRQTGRVTYSYRKRPTTASLGAIGGRFSFTDSR